MKQLTASDIKAISRHATPTIVNGIVEHQGILSVGSINKTPLRMAHFWAQNAHESAHFKTTVEYASGAVYEGRKDLGNTQKGDGKRFRGRGLIQLTGRANYTTFTRWMRQKSKDYPDFVKSPELVAEFPWALWSAVYYWTTRKLNQLADKDDVRRISIKINGGLNGYSDRQKYLKRAKAVFRVDGPMVLSKGDRDLYVMDLQKDLIELGYKLGSPDGAFGPMTEDAVMQFQRDSGLTVDGIAGPMTIEALKTAKPRTVSADRQKATVDDLRKTGSGTIKDADLGKKGTIGVGGAIVAIEAAKEAVGAAEEAKGLAERLMDLGPAILVAAAIIGGGFFIFNRIQKRRLEDPRSHAHRGR